MRALKPLQVARKKSRKGEGGSSVLSILTLRKLKVALPRLCPEKNRSPIKKYKMGRRHAQTTIAMSIW